MKKAIVFMMVLGLVVSFSVPVLADMGAVGDQAKGGIEKVVKSPLNVPNHIQEEYNNHDFKVFAVPGGLLKGLFYTAYDVGTGILDVVTSPLHLLPDK